MGDRREENMVGLTSDEAMKEADRNACGCLVASALVLALLALFAGWLVYLACSRWPVLCERLPPLGEGALWMAAAATATAAVAGSIEIRDTEG